MYLIVRKTRNKHAVKQWTVLFCVNSATIGGKYTLKTRDGSEPKSLRHDGHIFHLIEIIGSGGYGVVVRAEDLALTHRVIKLFLPPPSRSNYEPLSPGWLSESTNYDELSLTNKQPVKHVIAVSDHGKTAVEPPPSSLPAEFELNLAAKRRTTDLLPYNVSPFVDGIPLDKLSTLLSPIYDKLLLSPEAVRNIRDAMLSIFADILSGLSELHTTNIFHMDIRTANVLVFARKSPSTPLNEDSSSQALLEALLKTDVSWEGFLLDLGIARYVSASARGNSPIAISRPAFPEEYLPLLRENAPDGYVLSERLCAYGAAIDLNMFGRVVWNILMPGSKLFPVTGSAAKTEETRRTAFWRTVFKDDYPILTGIAEELVLGPKQPHIKAKEYLRRLRTIPLFSDRDVYSSSLLTDRYSSHQIRAGSVVVRFGDGLKDIIRHPIFQRLQRIHQLTMISEHFPDATHSRYSHSLRTFQTAKRAIMSLASNSGFRLLFSRHDVDTVLTAALLHDIGQYPLAHDIEDLRELGDLCKEPCLMRIRRDYELADAAFRKSDPTIGSLADLVTSNGFNAGDVLYCMTGEPEKGQSLPLRIGRSLISSTIDVDRIAYLVQDCEHSGVPFGSAIDIDALFDSFTLTPPLSFVSDTNPTGIQLAIDESGVSSAEAVFTAIYWMYRNVYWDSTNRAFASAVKFVVKRLFLDYGRDFEWLFTSIAGQSDWQALTLLSDEFERKCPTGIFNPLSDIVRHRQIRFNRVLTIQRADKATAALHRLIVKRLHLRSEEGIAGAVLTLLVSRGIRAEVGDVLVDITLKPRAYSRKSLPVLSRNHLSHRLSEPKDITDYSRLAGRLARMSDLEFGKTRVFLSERTLTQMSESQHVDLETRLPSVLLKYLSEE